MAISYACFACGHRGHAGDEFAGRIVKCPKCGASIDMAASSGPDSPFVAAPPKSKPTIKEPRAKVKRGFFSRLDELSGAKAAREHNKREKAERAKRRVKEESRRLAEEAEMHDRMKVPQLATVEHLRAIREELAKESDDAKTPYGAGCGLAIGVWLTTLSAAGMVGLSFDHTLKGREDGPPIDTFVLVVLIAVGSISIGCSFAHLFNHRR